MPQTILVVEDDEDLGNLLEYNLRRAGYRVEKLVRLLRAHEKVKELQPDLILLDVMLPDGDGFEFCRQLRADPATTEIPILFLSARGEEIDRVLGLEIGGDDYITKPFSPRELLARIKAHLRRKEGRQPETVESGPIRIEVAARRAYFDGELLTLTATEFRLLEFFLSNPGRVFSREQLLSNIWGDDTHVTPRNVDVHIRRLRERIERSPETPKRLQTVRGFGYRFENSSE